MEYIISFEYGGEKHEYPFWSSNNYSDKTFADAGFLADTLEELIDINKIPRDWSSAHNVQIFDEERKLIFTIEQVAIPTKKL